jgi:trimeric autotransporter adhesin
MGTKYGFQLRVRDSYGNVVADENISVYLAGTSTPAYIYSTYTATVGTSATPQLTSDDNGYVQLFVDPDDYDDGLAQLFDVDIDENDVNYTYLDIFKQGTSADVTLSGNSNSVVPTEKAVKTYVDTQVATVDEFTDLSDTPSSYSNVGALYNVNATADGVDETEVILTEDTNTFNIAKGTASLDIAAGAAIDVNASLTVESTSLIDQDLTTDSTTVQFDTLTATNINAFTLGGKLTAGANEVEGSNFDIDGGTIDGCSIDGCTIATSDITVGTGKTLDVSTGTLTLANDQISGDKVEGGTINAVTINTLTSTTVNATNINAFTLGGKLTAGINEIEGSNFDINGGTIDGCTIATSDITVGAGKTLDVSAGTLTLADDQISGDKVEGGTINAITVNTLGLSTGTTINEFSIDGTLAGDSDDAIPTEKAVKTYVDTQVATVDEFIDLSDTPNSYSNVGALYNVNATSDGIDETEVILTEGTNTFNIAKGTASLDIAAGAELDIDQNFTVNGYATTITGYDQSNTLYMYESLSIGNGYSGTLTFSAGSKILTVEDNSNVDQDLTTDSTTVQFDTLTTTTTKATTFDTNVAAAGVTLVGTTLSADGTDANIDISITPKGTGEVNITKVDIDGGTIDGTTIATSDVTVGAGKTLDVSAGTLTLADDQISGDKGEGGTINAVTITTLTSTTINAFTLGGKLTAGANEVEGSNFDINGGTIDGCTIATSDITVGAGKTLDVSDGTLTLANDQISGDKVEGGTINAITVNTLGLSTGTTVNEFSTDTTLADDSDDAVPTEKAVKTYVDDAITKNVTYNDSDTTINLTTSNLNGVLLVDNGSTVTINLPSVDSLDIGKWIQIHKMDAGDINIVRADSDVIENGTTISNVTSSQTWANITLFLAKETIWKFYGSPLGTWSTS